MRSVSAVALLAAAALVRVDEPVDFERDVQPILEEHCARCHSGERAKSGLRLDARQRAFRGGNSGEKAIVPGDPRASRLLALVRGEEGDLVMPPRGERLTAAQIATLERWIAAGAPWPDELSGDELVQEHWSFVPPVKPQPPAGSAARDPGFARNEIDLFVLQQLDENGLAPSPEADRATLARRLALDLVGLPPTREQVAAFLADGSPGAYERYVRSLLASPHFGERWARTWLDLARFADSTGYGQDNLRPFLWRWRDWVIDALNRNVPFDRFTIEQLAGDLLPEPTLDQLLATAFHRNTMTNVEGGTVDEEFRVAAVKDRVDATMSIWMGLTFGCAKCHSHKFDPIPHEDYYRFFAFFNQTQDADRADEEPRVATPTREQVARRETLAAKVASITARRDERAAELSAERARWETHVAQAERQWLPLRPLVAGSQQGAQLDVALDGTVRARGEAPATDVVAVEIEAPLAPIAALRLEALAEAGLQNGGPGRSDGNGNFVLNELRLLVVPERPLAPPRARWVRVELPGPARILSLAEVEVWSDGENAARTGAATQSSVDFAGPAALAIDGNPSGDYQAGSTTHTRHEADPWWEVDLGAVRTIEKVVVWNRTDGALQSRLDGARIVALIEAGDGREIAWQATLARAPSQSVALDPTTPPLVPFASATASFEQPRFGVAQAIDGDLAAGSGWAIGSQQGRRHVAILVPRSPLHAPGSRLRIELHQTFGDRHVLGAFRLSCWTSEAPPLALPSAVAAALARPAALRTPDEQRALAEHWRSIAPELAPYREALATLEAEIAALDAEIVRTPVMRELPPGQHRVTHVLQKSNYLSPGDRVEAAVPGSFPPLPAGAPANRLGVARWLVAPENPLTARVTVNRFWSRLFGRGLVETEEDFGTQGTPPSHPELLDWLAVRFVESGWDVKELLFTIVTSATYRQSSRAEASSLERDPRDVWLWRHPRRRLEAEIVRDQALAIAGLLSPKIGGPSVHPPQPDGIWQVAFNDQRTYPTSTGEDRWRRSLYTFWRRTVPPPSLQTFDAPSREVCTIRRQSTSTPLQAFVTLNDPGFVEAAQGFARRIVREGGRSPRERVAFALELALVRAPRDEEVEVLVELLESEQARFAAEPAAARTLAGSDALPLPDDLDPIELAAWTAVANVILNLDAVLTKS